LDLLRRWWHVVAFAGLIAAFDIALYRALPQAYRRPALASRQPSQAGETNQRAPEGLDGGPAVAAQLQALREYLAAAERRASEHEAQHHRVFAPENASQWALAVFAAVASLLAVRTLKANTVAAEASRESADTARDALIKLQRPFIFLEGWRQIPRWDTNPDGTQRNITWRISPLLGNAGNTPSKNMTLLINQALRDEPLPAGFVFSYRAQPGYVVVGPHARIEGPVSVISSGDLKAVQAGAKHFYVWGEAWYGDIFNAAPTHHFVFCSKVTNVLGNPENIRTDRNPDGTDVTFQMFHHDEHNYEIDEAP
jgi:hypothetical protein